MMIWLRSYMHAMIVAIVRVGLCAQTDWKKTTVNAMKENDKLVSEESLNDLNRISKYYRLLFVFVHSFWMLLIIVLRKKLYIGPMTRLLIMFLPHVCIDISFTVLALLVYCEFTQIFYEQMLFVYSSIEWWRLC